MQDFFLNTTIPHCPTNSTTPKPLRDIGYPTSAIIFVVFAVTALVFAIIIAFKYNSVKVFNRKIRTQNISNTLWIVYYLTIGLRASSGAVLYGLYPPDEGWLVHGIFFIAGIILSAINAFTLCLSLNHQRRYRSSAPPNPAPQSGGSLKEGDPLLGKSDLLRRSISPAEILFFILFAANLALFYAALKNQGNGHVGSLLVLIFIGSFIVERLPVIVLVLIIVIHRNGNEGPTRQSKVYLFLAAILHLSSDLPTFFWAQVLPAGCIIAESISYIDILTIVNYLALILFFLFLRSEYLRNMEECIWTTVSQIQDTFDFRRF